MLEPIKLRPLRKVLLLKDLALIGYKVIGEDFRVVKVLFVSREVKEVSF